MLKLRPASGTLKYLETELFCVHAGIVTVIWVLGEEWSNSGLIMLSNLFIKRLSLCQLYKFEWRGHIE
jgi:hypothetical protein